MDRTDNSMRRALHVLLKRVESLEARRARLEADANAPRTAAPAPTTRADGYSRHDDFSAEMAVLRAMNDYSRRQRIEDLRSRPQSLSAIRADHAARNAFLATRGLSPIPEPYPELP